MKSIHTFLQRLLAEALGTGLLLAIVIGSGIMGEKLSAGNSAIALLANAIATGAGLTVLIAVFAPISGAHFNPAVTLALWRCGKISGAHSAAYILVQIAAAIVGVIAANLMFDLSAISIASNIRSSAGIYFSEVIAAFGLVLVILRRPDQAAALVGLYIAAAYWFTASTSFANPAVTIARMFSDTFAGIRPDDVLAFIAAQLLGASLAYFAHRLFSTSALSTSNNKTIENKSQS